MDETMKNEAPQTGETPGEEKAPETDAKADQKAGDAQEAPQQGELAQALKKAEEYLDMAQRVQADFDNFRRRNESVRADSFAEGQRSAVTAMLDVRDNLERAVPLAEEGTPLQAGLVLTLKNLSAAFEKLGVKEISREGEKFDPNLENAVMQGITIGNFKLLYSVLASIAIAVIVYFYLKRTKQGYEIAVVGDSVNTARYAGMNVYKITVRTIFLSAALIGLAGAFAAATSGTISTDITNNVGWTGVIVAWLSRLSVPVIGVVSLLISVLQYGCQAASASYSQIDHNFADLMQGLFMFSILAAGFFSHFKIVRTGGKNDD